MKNKLTPLLEKTQLGIKMKGFLYLLEMGQKNLDDLEEDLNSMLVLMLSDKEFQTLVSIRHMVRILRLYESELLNGYNLMINLTDNDD